MTAKRYVPASIYCYEHSCCCATDFCHAFFSPEYWYLETALPIYLISFLFHNVFNLICAIKMLLKIDLSCLGHVTSNIVYTIQDVNILLKAVRGASRQVV